MPRLRPGETGDAETLTLDKVNQKRAKGGLAYAAGKTLIVFLEAGAGVWYPNTGSPDDLFKTARLSGLQPELGANIA